MLKNFARFIRLLEFDSLMILGQIISMHTDNVGHLIDGIVATRVVDQNRICRPTDRDDRMKLTHDNIETISEKLVY